jgi:hypothetical protein
MMEGWESFFVVEVGASGRLAGPIFVAPSANPQRGWLVEINR